MSQESRPDWKAHGTGTAPDELTRYARFFDLLEQALERVRSARLRSRTSHTRTSTLQLINQVERELGRRYMRAREGYPHLKRRDFELLVRLISPTCPASLVQSIKEAYEAYDQLDPEFSAKRSPRIGAGYISGKSVEKRFDRMLDAFDVTMPMLARDPELYRHFVDTLVEYPAYKDRQGEAISNGYIICEALERRRAKGAGDLSALSEVDFAAYLARPATSGAWAAQQVGQKSRFNDFLRRLVRAEKSGSRHATISLNLMVAHHNRRVSYLGGKPMKGGEVAARLAHLNLKEDILGFAETEDVTLVLNPARALILSGATLERPTEDIGAPSIGYLMAQAEDLSARNTATTYWSAHTHTLRSRAYLNDGNIQKALDEVETAALLNAGETGEGPSHAKTLVLQTKGLIIQQITGKPENSDLLEARGNAIRLGAFDRAMDIETNLGWRQRAE